MTAENEYRLGRRAFHQNQEESVAVAIAIVAVFLFAGGSYISDLHLGDMQTIEIRAFRLALSAFVRGRVHLHFESAEEAIGALLEAGFDDARVHPAQELTSERPGAGRRLAHILEASTR